MPSLPSVWCGKHCSRILVLFSFQIFWSAMFLSKKDPEEGSTLWQRLYLDNQHWRIALELHSQALIRAIFNHFFKAGVSNTRLVSRMRSSTAINAACHKILNFLKTFRFLCTYSKIYLSDRNWSDIFFFFPKIKINWKISQQVFEE